MKPWIISIIGAVLLAIVLVLVYWLVDEGRVGHPAALDPGDSRTATSSTTRSKVPFDPNGTLATAAMDRMILSGTARSISGTTLVRTATTFPSVAVGVEFDAGPVVAAARHRIGMWRAGGFSEYRQNWQLLGRAGEPWWMDQSSEPKAQYDQLTGAFPGLIRIDWGSAKVMPERAKGMVRNEHYTLEGSIIFSWRDKSDLGKRPLTSTGIDSDYYSRLRFKSEAFERAFVMAPFEFVDGSLNPGRKPLAIAFKLARGPETSGTWVVWEMTIVLPNIEVFQEHFYRLPR